MTTLALIKDGAIVATVTAGRSFDLPDGTRIGTKAVASLPMTDGYSLTGIAQADAIPEGKKSSGMTAQMVAGTPKWVHSLEDVPRDVPSEAREHALALKVAAVNVLATDGTALPVDQGALDAAIARYQLIVDRFNTDKNLGDVVVTPERETTVRNIRTGQDFFEAVDAAEAIIGADAAALDPIGTDPRWPAPPAA